MMVVMMVMVMIMTMVVMTMVMMVVTTMMMAVVVSMAGGPNTQGSDLWDLAFMAMLSNDARNIAPRLKPPWVVRCPQPLVNGIIEFWLRMYRERKHTG